MLLTTMVGFKLFLQSQGRKWENYLKVPSKLVDCILTPISKMPEVLFPEKRDGIFHNSNEVGNLML